MPKKVDYPKASFNKSLDLAEAVRALGGSCSSEIAGSKLGVSGTSGGFKTLVGAAVKHGLVKIEKGILYNTGLFKAIELSYTDVERIDNLRKAFLAPTIFNQLYEKLKGKELPIAILDKVLIKEYYVEEEFASRVSKYFISGAKQVKLIDGQNILLSSEDSTSVIEVTEEVSVDLTKSDIKRSDVMKIDVKGDDVISLTDKYLIQIIGPGLNTRLEVNDVDDLAIVDITLAKIKKKLSHGTD